VLASAGSQALMGARRLQYWATFPVGLRADFRCSQSLRWGLTKYMHYYYFVLAIPEEAADDDGLGFRLRLIRLRMLLFWPIPVMGEAP
jgi:hypothetical protein